MLLDNNKEAVFSSHNMMSEEEEEEEMKEDYIGGLVGVSAKYREEMMGVAEVTER